MVILVIKINKLGLKGFITVKLIEKNSKEKELPQRSYLIK